MDRDVVLLLTGAGIALVSSIIAAVATHLLSLREDRIKRARTRQEELRKQIEGEATERAQLVRLIGEEQAQRLVTQHLLMGSENLASRPLQALLSEQHGDIMGILNRLEHALNKIVSMGDRDLERQEYVHKEVASLLTRLEPLLARLLKVLDAAEERRWREEQQ